MSPSPSLRAPCTSVTSNPSGASAGDNPAAWIAGPPMFSRVITRSTGIRARRVVSGLGTMPADSMPERLPVTHKGPANPERSFGVSVGIVLLLIAALLAWRGRMTAAPIAGGVGATLLLLGLVAARLLKWPSAVWWKL